VCGSQYYEKSSLQQPNTRSGQAVNN